MADERIDIVIQDRVSSGVATKIRDIAKAAREADNAVKKLKQSLSMLDSSSIQRLTRSLNIVNTALSRTALAQQRLATETQRTAVQTANAAAAQNRAALAALRLQQAQERAAQASQGLSRGFVNMARSAAAVVGLGLSVHALLEASDAYTVLQNKLRNVTDSEAQLEEVTRRVFNVANETRTEVQATAQAFTRFDLAIKQLGGSQEESLRLTKTINELLAVSGATSSEAASGLLQLSQAFNKGKLDGDEFRSVMELMPGAADAIAKQLKVTRGELLKLAPEGKITGEVLRKAFAAVAEETDAKFAKTVPTISQALTVLRNNATQAFGELNKSVGFTEALSKAIIFLSEHIKALTVIALTVGTALLVAFGPALLAALGAATSAVIGFTAAIAANPIGLLAVAIASAIAIIVVFKDEMLSLNGVEAAWYNELVDLVDFIGQYFAPLLQTVAGYFTDLTKETADFNLTAFLFKGAVEFMIDVLKVVAIVGSDVIFTFKSVGMEIGAIIAQLGVLARLGTVTEFNAISDAVKEDAAKARKELDEFQKKVLEFGSKSRIDSGVALQNAAPKTPAVSTLRGTGTPAKVGPDAKELKAIETRRMALQKINAELDKEVNTLTLLKPERDVQQKIDQIEINLASKKIKLTQGERGAILDKIKSIEENKATQQAFDQIYESSIATQRDYNAQVNAAAKLLDMGAISTEDYRKAVTLASEAYKQAKDPLFAFNRDLEQQFDLLRKVGPEQNIAAQLQQLQNEQLAKGTPLTQAQTTAIRDKLETLEQEKLLNQELNRIYDETKGQQESLALQVKAVNEAYASGILTLDQYSQRLVKLGVDQANLRLQMGDGTFEDMTIASLGRIVEGFENASVSMSNIMGDFFQNFTNGFADSVGNAIVKSEDLGEALKSVAQDAVASLISSLIKLGVQYAVNAAIGQSVGASALAANTAASVAAAGTTAAAWAPAAALASLASFGANSVPASAGILATTALSEGIALASVAGFESGGYTGNGATNDVAGVVHGQEFVVNADATRRNRAALEAMNRGGSMSKSSSGSGGGAGVQVSIENYGTSKEFEVQQLSENQVRVIARDEAKSVVRSETQGVVASAINNPNSQVSKSLNKSTQTQRRRE